MSDADLALSCTRGAEALVDGLRRDSGITALDFSIASAEKVDNLIDTLLSADPIPEQMQLLIGLYVGEILVRNLGGQWVPNAQFMQPAVKLPTGFAFPIEKVKTRIAKGPGDSVETFVSQMAIGPPTTKDDAARRGWRLRRRP